MRIVLACTVPVLWGELLSEGYPSILHSYEYRDSLYRVFDQNEIKGKNLYIDSGAFSAWNKGAEIDLLEYIEFVKDIMERKPDNEWNIVNLDVIPGKPNCVPTREEIEYSAEQGWANYETMRSNGLNPIHIFHQHEDFIWLERLMKSSDYIGISPDNSQSTKSRLIWLRKVFSIVQRKVKTHGFAATGDTFVKNIPFYSVDSASWLNGAMYGKTSKFVDGKMKLLDLNDRSDAITSRFKRRGRTIGLENMHLSIREYVKKQDFVTRLWEKRGISWQ